MARNGSKKPTGGVVAVKSLKHDEATRRNIPTIENEALVADDLKAPMAVDYKRTSVLLYPRKMEADPQLVWRGKDQEDYDGDLIVRSTPIYVHEHITPQQIIKSLQDDTLERADAPELFERDFNGLTEEQRLRFYEFDGHWTNRMILGDSAAIMASLSEREKLQGQVQTIFMDPPYGIQFRSNFQPEANQTRVKDGKAESISTEPEQIKAYRDTWRDGIHSFLSYLRDRLTVSRDLLTKSGSIFVQIGEDNLHLVRCLLDEIFGAKNIVAQIAFVKTTGFNQDTLNCVADYILWYARDVEHVKYRALYQKKNEDLTSIPGLRVELPDGSRRSVTKQERQNPSLLPPGAKLYTPGDLTSSGNGGDTRFPFEFSGHEYWPKAGRYWSTHLRGLQRLVSANRVEKGDKGVYYTRFLDDFGYTQYSNIWTDTQIGGFGDKKIYVVQTNTKVLERCLLMTTDPGDLVLDPTCGSGTTAYCSEKWGRRWITMDTSRVALMLARQRLLSAEFAFYYLADSQEGRLEEARLSGTLVPTDIPSPQGNVAKGFVLERAPRITLGMIANNEEIVDGMSRESLDVAIRKSGEVTYFVDRPLIDKSAVRVSGPFTVESLAPTEAEPLDDEYRQSSSNGDQGDFVSLVIDNIRTSGIVNGEKGGRTRFTSVDPFPGEYVNAVGVTEDGHRFGIAVGPKEGTVGPGFMRAAAREAMNVAIVETLAVCGFAFESAATTEKMGTLLVLKVRMNQDMQIGNMLKKGKSETLFRVYGEPDVRIEKVDAQYTVEVRGMDVYDPAKREVRSAGTDKIQAWFLDTNYDGERFIVRHVYFLGDTGVFDDLQRALKGEIDEEGWQSIYSATSRPFSKPKTGKIAIKVITVYGDESVVVLKV
jgi:adenine-specific DNA-methyltransferase